MGLSVVATDYSGKVFERINDPKNFLHKLLPRPTRSLRPYWQKSIGTEIPTLTIFKWRSFFENGIGWLNALRHLRKTNCFME